MERRTGAMDGSAPERAPAPPAAHHPEEGGESPCWLDRVCPECGRFADGATPPAVCARCGAPFAPHAPG
ncbi:hypothetical protein [Streptomyces sp. Z26]|uniref:hypothetical protein n=1 Tax=Streptomyces sp. Z26 TaxID=2500177 RepID=UPI001F0CD82C|nr:hypothetical protein [Streptomyces sp. Z26]